MDLPTPGDPITPITVKSVFSVKNCQHFPNAMAINSKHFCCVTKERRVKRDLQGESDRCGNPRSRREGWGMLQTEDENGAEWSRHRRRHHARIYRRRDLRWRVQALLKGFLEKPPTPPWLIVSFWAVYNHSVANFAGRVGSLC